MKPDRVVLRARKRVKGGLQKAAIRSDAKLHSCYCQPRANLVGKVGNNGQGQVKTKIRRKLSFDIELARGKVGGGGLSCNHNHGKVLTKTRRKCRLVLIYREVPWLVKGEA